VLISRRAALFSSLAASRTAGQLLTPREFWNSKPPSDWSPDEIAQLTTASPWAVKTRVKMAGSLFRPKPVVSADLPTRGGGGRANKQAAASDESIAPEPRSSTANSSAPVAFYGEVVVSWESAEPLRRARNAPLPPEFDNHYALRVTGLPHQTFMPDTGRTPVIFRLLVGTTLEVNGRREQSDYVLRMPEKNSILFAFPSRSFPLSAADRSVLFAMNLNQMMIRARFDLRLMTFEEAVAV
jgi:hypothetical protein